ncbi:MAG: amidohydrolase family protein, partial [Nocardioidaceae bacterium]
PTLVTYRTLAGGGGGSIPAYATAKAREVVDAHQASFAMALRAEIPVIAGTDAGAPQTPHPALVDELLVMHEYGMPVAEALRSATSQAARAIGLPHGAGTIAEGAPGDLLILEDDPFADLDNLRRVWGVVRAGRPVSRR